MDLGLEAHRSQDRFLRRVAHYRPTATRSAARPTTEERENEVMNANDNKKLLQHIFAELAKGNSRPLVDNMADDFSWTITGTTEWSKKYEGKLAVVNELFGSLQAKLT